MSTSNISTGGRSTALDLARGFAAVSVLLLHTRFFSFVGYDDIPTNNRSILSVLIYGSSKLGAEGVLVFFVLSGFLIGGKLLSAVDGRSFSSDIYWTERISRILPPLTAAVLFTSFVEEIMSIKQSLFQAAGNILGLNGLIVDTMVSNGPLWSIAYEIWLYVFGWSVVTIILGIFWPLNCLGLVACCIVFLHFQPYYLAYWWIGAFSSKLFGASFSRIYLVGGLLLIATSSFIYQLMLSDPLLSHSIQSALVETVIAFGCAMTIPSLISTEMNIVLYPIRGYARGLSNISFSLYLLHYPLNIVLNRYLGSNLPFDGEAVCFYGLRLAICFSCAGMFSFVFEEACRPACRRLIGLFLNKLSS